MNNFSVLVKMDGIRYFCVVITNLLNNKTMRANIEAYKAVEEAAMKFVKSVAEGNSKYAKELFIDEAVLFGYLDGKLEHGSIEQFYHNVDTVGAGDDFKARVDWWMWRRPLPWSACWKRNGVAALTSLIICC